MDEPSDVVQGLLQSVCHGALGQGHEDGDIRLDKLALVKPHVM